MSLYSRCVVRKTPHLARVLERNLLHYRVHHDQHVAIRELGAHVFVQVVQRQCDTVFVGVDNYQAPAHIDANDNQGMVTHAHDVIEVGNTI